MQVAVLLVETGPDSGTSGTVSAPATAGTRSVIHVLLPMAVFSIMYHYYHVHFCDRVIKLTVPTSLPGLQQLH